MIDIPHSIKISLAIEELLNLISEIEKNIVDRYGYLITIKHLCDIYGDSTLVKFIKVGDHSTVIVGETIIDVDDKDHTEWLARNVFFKKINEKLNEEQKNRNEKSYDVSL